MAWGWKPEGSRNVDPDMAKVDREAKPELDPKVVERFKRQGEGMKPPGSRNIDPDMM